MNLKSALIAGIILCVCAETQSQTNNSSNASSTFTNDIRVPAEFRLVNGKLYNANKSKSWGFVADLATGSGRSQWQYALLEVTSIGQTSVVCNVYQNDNGLPPLPGIKKHGAFLKKVVIFNHPFQNQLTTGEILKPCPAMRVGNWRSGDTSLEAYDCGVPATAEDLRKAGIPIPTPTQLAAVKKLAADKTEAAQREAQERALAFNRAQAEKGEPYGLFRMGERFRDGDGVPKDLDKARDYFKQAVLAGSQEAQKALLRLNQSP